MTTRNGINLKDHSCFICGKVVESAHFPLSSARLETLQKSLLNEIRSQIKQSISGTAVDEEFLCHHCGALLDLVNDLETKLADVRSTLSSLWCKNIRNFFGTSKVIGGECPRVGSCNSLQSGKSYCKSSQNNFQVAELSTGESENQESASLLEEESSSENFCKMCSFSSNSEEMLKFHISSEHKEFVCSECDIVLVSSDELNDHIKEKHLGKLVCHICDKVFSSELSFTNHSRLHLKGLSGLSIEQIERENGDLNANLLSEGSASALENHQCSYCNYTTSCKNLFDDHIRSHVALKLFKCITCSLLFESKALLNEHKRSHDKLLYVCGLCRRSFISRDLVINHLKERHKQSSEKSDLKQIKVKQEYKNHLSDLNVKNYMENISSVASYSSSMSMSNMYPKGAVSSSTKETEIVKKENLGAALSEEFTNVIHPEASNKEIPRLSGNFVEGFESESLSEKTPSIIEKTFLKIGNCFKIQENPSNISDSSSRTFLGSVKSTTSTQQNQITMMSCPKEDKVVGRSDVHLVPVFQNMVDSCNDESGFSSADISSEGLIIHSSKEGSSTKYSEVKYQLLGSRENNINENSITEVKLSEDNENDKNEGLWVSLSSFVDSENLNGPLEENQAIKGEKHTKLFICGKCGYKSFSAPEITEHVASHSGGTSEKVLLDDGGTSSAHPPLLGNVASADSKFSCSYCAWKSNDKLDLRNHINENHSNKNAVYICGFCKKKFTSKLQLTHHEASHGRTKIFRCKICKKGFSRENLLNRHVRFAHSSSKCCFCTKTLHSMEELSEHKSKHEQEDGYQCLECPRIFKTKTGLKFHSAQHTGEYKFRCQYCDQGFMSRVVYQEHMGKHTKEERYICDICGRKFCFQSTYWIHRKWHDTPFPYKCDICDRPFRHSSLLKVHKRQHTGERPYHCPHCSRSFSVSGTLKRHLMLHTGDYAFSCGECEKGFTTRNKFALHLSRVHGNDSLLQQGPPKTEFKMVIRDSPKSPEGKVLEGKVNEEDLIVQNYDELDSMMVQDGGIVGDGADLLKESSLMLPCSILDDVSGSLETRVVEILVNDETSQAVATVTVEGNSSLVSW